jgi:tetratricopeptide (TPR) repeat protein
VKRILLAVVLLIAGISRVSTANSNTDFCEEFVRLGEYAQAIDACTVQLYNTQSKEKLPYLYYYRGRAYEQKGDSEKAFSDLTKALELNNKLYPANISLGMIYYHRGSLDKAIAQYNRAIELKPKSLYFCAIYTNRGNAYRLQGNFDLAIADYTTCIDSNPSKDSLANALGMRGSAYLSKKEYDLSISDSSRAIELNPKLFSAYNQRGLALHLKGKYDEAVSDFSNAINLQPIGVNLFGTYANRGNALKAKGQYDLAITDYNKAVELNHNIPNTLYKLACANSLASKISDACAALQKAIENGYVDWDNIKNDIELKNVRESPCYREIMKGK